MGVAVGWLVGFGVGTALLSFTSDNGVAVGDAVGFAVAVGSGATSAGTFVGLEVGLVITATTSMPDEALAIGMISVSGVEPGSSCSSFRIASYSRFFGKASTLSASLSTNISCDSTLTCSTGSVTSSGVLHEHSKRLVSRKPEIFEKQLTASFFTLLSPFVLKCFCKNYSIQNAKIQMCERGLRVLPKTEL